MTWVRVSDASAGSPARRTITYRNVDDCPSGTPVLATVSYVSGAFGGDGYYVRVGTLTELLGPYGTDAEAKAQADAILQPFYIDLP